MEPTTIRFATTARVLGEAARRLDLAAPGFRSPPRVAEVDRSLRRRGEELVVAVRLRGRPWPAVVADMVEGVVATNELREAAASRARAGLWEALAAQGLTAEDAVVDGPPVRPGRRGSPGAGRVAALAADAA